MLEDERRYYQAHVDEWLSRYPGKFVVVRGEELVGAFDTIGEALAEGARRFGLTPFLVRRVERTPEKVTIPALALGLLHADSTRPVDG